MTVTEHENEVTERAERPVLHREFAAEVTSLEGRTVDVRIVPYGERIEHNDGQGGARPGVTYREEFAPGVFDHQLNAANRVVANYEHQEGIEGVVGHGIALRSEPDGFHGSFEIHETAKGDTALALIRAGVLDGVSLEAEAVKNIRSSEGVVQRVKANLRNIAFTRFAAYAGARVLAVREEATFTFDEAFLPVEPNPELIERCRRLGIKLPQRYQAHPAETDTPDSSGTPEDGTRQDIGNPDGKADAL